LQASITDNKNSNNNKNQFDESSPGQKCELILNFSLPTKHKTNKTTNDKLNQIESQFVVVCPKNQRLTRVTT